MNDDFYKQFAKVIEADTDPGSKEFSALLYGMIMYMDYIKEIDPTIHKKAMEYMIDTHGLKGINISLHDKTDYD